MSRIFLANFICSSILFLISFVACLAFGVSIVSWSNVETISSNVLAALVLFTVLAVNLRSLIYSWAEETLTSLGMFTVSVLLILSPSCFILLLSDVSCANLF
ncbi:hypothetical protein RND81_01G021800 [Saponaria officinalis]|uniref:NADH dehydrogenase subunit 4L n=1 Tax=Saponaria officinalis TaxID=3572 RepID=A0AAW1NFM2_SAPOF